VLAPSEEHIPGAQWSTVPELLIPLRGAAASFFAIERAKLLASASVGAPDPRAKLIALTLLASDGGDGA
jgi:hypothetical protein